MKNNTRAQKLMALQSAINGDSSLLREYKNGLLEPITSIVIYDTIRPKPDDLVDTRLPDAKGRTRVTYAEFLNDPSTYGRSCIEVEKDGFAKII